MKEIKLRIEEKTYEELKARLTIKRVCGSAGDMMDDLIGMVVEGIEKKLKVINIVKK